MTGARALGLGGFALLARPKNRAGDSASQGSLRSIFPRPSSSCAGRPEPVPLFMLDLRLGSGPRAVRAIEDANRINNGNFRERLPAASVCGGQQPVQR